MIIEGGIVDDNDEGIDSCEWDEFIIYKTIATSTDLH